MRFSAELTQALKSLAKAHGATLYMTVLAAFQVLLHRYTGQEDILVGFPKAGRRRKMTRVMGYFINPVVLRADLSGDPTFSAFLDQVRQTVLDASDHDAYPFPLLVERLQPARDPSRLPLIQVMFSWQKTTRLVDSRRMTSFALADEGKGMDLAGLSLEVVALEQRPTPFDWTLLVGEAGEGLGVTVEYNTDLFDAATIARMLGHFQTLLKGIVAAPEQHVSALPLLTEAEWQQLLVEWNDTAADYPQDRCVHQIFEARVERTPDAVAVVFPSTRLRRAQSSRSRRGEQERLTYRELNQRANQLARYLQKLDVGPESLVGICVERSLEMVVGVLGVLKAGGAYVPLDPQYPHERLAFMLEDARVPVLLTQEWLVERLRISKSANRQINASPQVICLDADWAEIAQENDENPVSGVTPDNLAYVIYTSGSTGKPKGVPLQHRGLCNLVNAQVRAFDVEEDSRVLQFASFSFDASVSEIFMALLRGATLYLPRQNTLLSPPALIQLLRNQEITIVTLPPSVMSVLPEEDLPALQTVISAGESCSEDIVARWSPGRRFFNAYGPTEATIGPTLYRVEELPAGTTSVPIGRPIANTQVYLLDSHLQPVPVGVPGEVHIGGVGLARRYLNRPELTAERFIPNPFAPPTRGGGQGGEERLYKTGDLARYLPAGNIEFLGRIDHQVKVRGFRIELGEIEAVLRQHPALQEAVVLAREDEPGDPSTSLRTSKRLVAYVVPTDERRRTKDEASVSTIAPPLPDQVSSSVLCPSSLLNELRSFLKARLPKYMVPSAFVTLDALPLTPNGKVDRKALPAPKSDRPELETTYVMPQTEVERAVASVWQAVLGVENVGIHDNFFDLGGHSLMVAKVHNQLQQIFKRDLPIVEMFRYPTIGALAKYLSREPGDQPSVQRSLDRASKQKEAIKRQKQRMSMISKRRVAARRHA